MTYQKGMILHTLDGSKIGNAIIIDVLTHVVTQEDVFAVHTDFGNTCFFNEREVDEFFGPGPITSIEQWQHDRFHNRMKTIVQPQCLTAKA